MPVHAALATVDDLPLLAHLVDTLIPLSADARKLVYVVCDNGVGDEVDAALAALPRIDAFEDDKTTAKVDARTLGDVRAICSSLSTILEAKQDGPYIIASAYFYGTTRAVASDREEVRAALTSAGLTCADAASLREGRAKVEDAAVIAKVMGELEKHYEPAVIEALRAYLGGPGGPIPPVVLDAKSEHYGDGRGSFLYSVLTGAAERWNEGACARLLDLWTAWRRPLQIDLSLGLGEDDLEPELGLDRARTIVEALEARGLPTALATLAACGYQGASSWFVAPMLLARPEALEQAIAVDRDIARALAAKAVPKMGLERSPSVQERLRAFVATHSEALGAEALMEIADLLPKALDEKHLENAAKGADASAVCKLAAKLEKANKKRFEGALSRANEMWMAACPDPASLAITLDRMLDRDKDHVDTDVAWKHLMVAFTKNPSAPFGERLEDRGSQAGLGCVIRMPAPKGKTKKDLEALCKAHGPALGVFFRKQLEKKAGIKPPPAPYDDADLAGVEDAWAKAWKTARKKSWEAGVRLPAGASEAALDAAEKALGHELPGDLRSFYALHDGAGPDECFRSCRLYGIEQAVAKRAWLLEVDGAPFDAGWLPVTDDGGGNHACVVLTGKNAGAVMDFDHETGCGRMLAKSFAAFVQSATWE